MTEEKQPGSEILEELESLGQQLATAVRSLWESEDSRQLRREIGEGFAELGRQIETAVHSAQESDAVKQFGNQVKDTVDRARETDVAGKLEEGLLSGLRELNEQISKLVDSMSGETAETASEGENET